MALVKIITGENDSGKTTAAEKIIADCTAAGQRAAGFISEAEYFEGKKDAYFIRDITTGRRVAAVSAVNPGNSGWRKYDFSRFWFSDQAFAFSAEIIKGIISDCKSGAGPDLVIVDELGPLELAGQGHFHPVYGLLRNFDNAVCLVIRETVVEEILDKLFVDIKKTEFIRPSR